MTKHLPVTVVVQPYDVHLMICSGLGLPIVALVDTAAPRTETGRRLAELVPTLYAPLDDPTSVAGALRRAREEHVAQRVVQFCDERRMETVATVAAALGLGTEPSSSYRALNDKEQFLAIGSKVGGVSRAWASASMRDGLARVEAAGGPWLLKPSDGSGSRGIVLLHRWVDVLPLLDGDRWVLEQYRPGREYSVETLTVDGEHHVFAVTQKATSGPPHFVERGHVVPACLDAEVEHRMRDLVMAFLDAAGYRDGPAHTEVIVDPAGTGFELVESQARLGGDRIPTLVARATGVDPEVELYRSLLNGRPPRRVTTHRRAAIAYVELPHGRLVTKVDLTPGPAAEALEVQLVGGPGRLLGEATSSSERHVGLILDRPLDEPVVPSTRPLRAVVRVDERPATLVLFGATDEQVAACVALGHVLVLVQTHDQLTKAQVAAASVVVMCDIGARSTVDWAAEQLAPYATLPFVSARQYGVLLRALVCERLGLEPLSSVRCSETVADKIALRRRIDELDLPAPRWAIVSSAEDVRSFCTDHGGRGVLKIARGTGGVGVRHVRSDEDVDLQSLRSRVSDVLPDGVAAAPLLVEECLDGPLFSVESVWVRGRHVPLGITTSEVSPTSSAELRHTFPGVVDDRIRADAVRQVEQLFGMLGMYSGGTHVEFLVVDGAPVMIDAHDRPGGGHIPELIARVLGHSSTYLALGAQTGAVSAEDIGGLRPSRVAVVRFVTVPREIRVAGRDNLRRMLVTVADLPGIEHVHLDPDVDALPAEADNWTRPGHVIAVAPTVEEAQARADDAYTRIVAALLAEEETSVPPGEGRTIL